MDNKHSHCKGVKISWVTFRPCVPQHCLSAVLLTVFASFSELEELLQALKWMQHCLTDAQSQQDVELIMQLLAKEDFKNAYTIYNAVSQQMTRVSPTSPLTAQAQDLCQEVRIMVILKQLLKAENKNHVEALWFCHSMKSEGKIKTICKGLSVSIVVTIASVLVNLFILLGLIVCKCKWFLCPQLQEKLSQG